MYQSLLFLLASGLLMSAVQAAEWAITANVDPSTEYDDNVFMSEEEQDSVHFSVSPTVVVSHALENAETSVSLGYKIDRYTSLSDLDTDNPFARFDTTYQTERSQWGLAASYVESPSRTDAANDTGDFTTQSIITTKTVSPSYRYQLSERDNISVSASYSERKYSTTDFGDNETKSLTTAWQRQYTERLSGGISATVSNYQSESLTSSSENDNYNLSLTATYQWSETWQINGRVGARYLKSEQTNSLGVKESNSSAGSSFNFTASRQGEIDSLTIGVSRELSPSSSGDVNEQTGLNITWSRDLSETLTANISGRYQETTSADDDGNDKRENINFSPSLRWQLERNMGLNLSYNYRQQKRSDQDDVDSNALMLTLNYDWDGLRASR